MATDYFYNKFTNLGGRPSASDRIRVVRRVSAKKLEMCVIPLFLFLFLFLLIFLFLFPFLFQSIPNPNPNPMSFLFLLCALI